MVIKSAVSDAHGATGALHELQRTNDNLEQTSPHIFTGFLLVLIFADVVCRRGFALLTPARQNQTDFFINYAPTGSVIVRGHTGHNGYEREHDSYE
jgi:hypothetical protein